MRENFHQTFCLKKAGQAQNRGLTALLSKVSVSHSTRGTVAGQQRDNGTNRDVMCVGKLYKGMYGKPKAANNYLLNSL